MRTPHPARLVAAFALLAGAAAGMVLTRRALLRGRPARPGPWRLEMPDDPAFAGGERAAPEGSPTNIRPAGPEAMRDPPGNDEWDAVDEAADESFPASDPPARY